MNVDTKYGWPILNCVRSGARERRNLVNVEENYEDAVDSDTNCSLHVSAKYTSVHEVIDRGRCAGLSQRIDSFPRGVDILQGDDVGAYEVLDVLVLEVYMSGADSGIVALSHGDFRTAVDLNNGTLESRFVGPHALVDHLEEELSQPTHFTAAR